MIKVSGLRGQAQSNPSRRSTRTRRRFHANATSPDEYGCKTVGFAYPGRALDR